MIFWCTICGWERSEISIDATEENGVCVAQTPLVRGVAFSGVRQRMLDRSTRARPTCIAARWFVCPGALTIRLP